MLKGDSGFALIDCSAMHESNLEAPLGDGTPPAFFCRFS
ncbi:hypothetical protein SynA1544_00892 [Synechococcus sp. A15-44]|nr:hypothetical protein SynA1544_00892 [Synechococcus sp. A15-44]